MFRAVVVLMLFLGLACGDDSEPAQEAQELEDVRPDDAETILARDTPEGLRNLWEANMEPDTELWIWETSAGPVYVYEESRFGFGSCDATDELGDEWYTWVCNP